MIKLMKMVQYERDVCYCYCHLCQFGVICTGGIRLPEQTEGNPAYFWLPQKLIQVLYYIPEREKPRVYFDAKFKIYLTQEATNIS